MNSRPAKTPFTIPAFSMNVNAFSKVQFGDLNHHFFNSSVNYIRIHEILHDLQSLPYASEFMIPTAEPVHSRKVSTYSGIPSIISARHSS
jgi:hypothetical protein